MKKSDPKWQKVGALAAKVPEIMKHKLDEKKVEAIPVPRPENVASDVKDGWRQLNSRKWELRHDGLVLGTIFHKPEGKFSLWFKTPMIYEKLGMITSRTHLCDSFDEATTQFTLLLKENTEAWCKATLSFLSDVSNNT